MIGGVVAGIAVLAVAAGVGVFLYSKRRAAASSKADKSKYAPH